MGSQKYYVYFGSYTGKADQGLYVYTLDAESAEFTFVESYAGIDNPSFLAIDARKQRLYVVSEEDTYEGTKGGSVSAFALDPQTGKLTMLNQQPTTGTASCHVSVDPTSSMVLVANYSGGSINAFPLNENGEIGTISSDIQHHGKGVNPARQEGPHPHSVFLDPSGKYVFSPDLGLDKVFCYKLDTQAHTLTFDNVTEVNAGAGPRHLAFHPSGAYVYVIDELASTVTTCSYDANLAHLTPLQSISTLPADFTGESTCADIHVAPSGKFVYGSNRGHDSIAVFSVAPETGLLSLVEVVSTQGKTPRNFALAPDGRFLFAANQDSSTVITYSIDQSTGRLTPIGSVLDIAHPVCIKILAV